MRDYGRELFCIREKLLLTIDNASTSREDKIRIRRRKILSLIVGYTAIGGISLADISRIIDVDRKYLKKHLQSLQTDGLVHREKGKHGRYLATKYIPSDTYLSAEILVKLFVAYVLRPTAHIQDAKEKDLVIQKWVSDVFSELQEYLLPIFKYYIQNSILTLDRCKKNGIGISMLNYIYKDPKYIFDNSIIDDLACAFSKAYPDLYRNLEKVRKRWPRIVQQTNDNITYLSMHREIQMNCKHDFKECRIPIGQGLNPLIIRPGFHCSKCHRTVDKDKKKHRTP